VTVECASNRSGSAVAGVRILPTKPPIAARISRRTLLPATAALSRRPPLTPASPAIAALPRRAWIALAVIVAIAWFANLDVRKLQHPDEGRYAEIAREMLVTGDWVTPRLNGLKYFEKPPLQYWLTAASFKAFEQDEWTARLPGATAGFLTVAVVAATGTALAGAAAGLYAGLVLAGSVWLFGISHLVTLDAVLTFWLTLALCAFLRAQQAHDSKPRVRRWMLVAYAATAAGVLTKGLVALAIPFASLFLYTLVTRDRGPWRRLHFVKGLALLFALAAPWFVAVSLRNPEFARFFFIHEHFERFLTTEHRRVGAWWYFVPLFLAGFLPWTGLFLWRLRQSWREATPGEGGFAWAKFCLVWTAFVFVFFSLSGSKLPSYILPMFPSAALVLGWQLERTRTATLAAATAALAGVTLVLWLVALAGWPRLAEALADARTPRAIYDALGHWVKIAFGVAGAGYVAGYLAFRRGEARGRSLGIAALSLATMLSMQAVFAGSDVFRTTRSAADLVTTLENAANPPYDRTAPFFQVEMYDQTLPFYLERTTTLVQYRDELALGLDAEPGRGIAKLSDWIARWQALPQAYALMSPQLHEQLAKESLPMRVVASDPRRVLVARH
jgi:4-amino-4-deoxy-L-arabinose transferase-like glycosyltransferase